MTTARDIMSTQVRTVSEDQSLVDAAVLMRDHSVGAVPVTAADGRLVGIVTDRDIVVSGVASGRDLAATAAGQLAQGIVSTVSPDEDIDRIVATMGDQQIKRLVVMEGTQLVGMISEADLARHVADDKVVDFVKMVYGRG
ncbi:CBS domain-containing protein [Ornithinimicrobium flavum]|uniref:CBS domain-containing protein n=1 Tax=Ornithinimicrobium flavum TaxID=1288636 RepID=UPI0010705316|nr:CBS domain-containing protein [Ornithinimicrobium flavum]